MANEIPNPMTNPLQVFLDNLFADLEADVAYFPRIQDYLQAVHAMVDSWFMVNAERAKSLATGVGPVQDLVDKIFADILAANTGRPLVRFAVQIIQNLVDGWFATHPMAKLPA